MVPRVDCRAAQLTTTNPSWNEESLTFKDERVQSPWSERRCREKHPPWRKAQVPPHFKRNRTMTSRLTKRQTASVNLKQQIADLTAQLNAKNDLEAAESKRLKKKEEAEALAKRHATESSLPHLKWKGEHVFRMDYKDAIPPASFRLTYFALGCYYLLQILFSAFLSGLIKFVLFTLLEPFMHEYQVLHALACLLFLVLEITPHFHPEIACGLAFYNGVNPVSAWAHLPLTARNLIGIQKRRYYNVSVTPLGREEYANLTDVRVGPHKNGTLATYEPGFARVIVSTPSVKLHELLPFTFARVVRGLSRSMLTTPFIMMFFFAISLTVTQHLTFLFVDTPILIIFLYSLTNFTISVSYTYLYAHLFAKCTRVQFPFRVKDFIAPITALNAASYQKMYEGSNLKAEMDFLVKRALGNDTETNISGVDTYANDFYGTVQFLMQIRQSHARYLAQKRELVFQPAL